MSNADLARRAIAEVAFDGVDITESIRPYLKSLTYIDSEEDEADDLQIKLQDREALWLEKWLGDMINAAATSDSEMEEAAVEQEPLYSVTPKIGLNVRRGPSTSYGRYGALRYGAVVKVISTENGWAKIEYNGKDAYVCAQYLAPVNYGSSDGWTVGEPVIANGRPQYTSYGTRPGGRVTDYQGTITYLNLRPGVPYPIHVSNLGWFAESEVQKIGSTVAQREKDRETPSTALKIQAVITTLNWNGDGKDSVLECGQFELDSIDASGPPSEVTIKATALPYTSTIRQTKKSRAWESYNLSGIAEEIAKSNGMTCMYLADTDPHYARIEQFQTPDINFLSARCKAAGISLKVSNNILVLFDQASYEAKSTVLTIRRGDTTYTKYKIGTGKKDHEYSSCRVRWTTGSGRLIEGVAKVSDYKEDAKTNQQLEIRSAVSSTDEAKVLAAKMLRMHNKFQKTANFTLPGNPKLVSGVTVQLEDWGDWSGKYIIMEARHTLSGSYTTQIKLRKTLEGY